MFLLLLETQRGKEASESGKSEGSEEMAGFRMKGLKLLQCLRLVWWLALNVSLFSPSPLLPLLMVSDLPPAGSCVSL